MKKEKVVIACDHSGLEVKSNIISSFSDFVFKDVGVYNTDSCDYPDVVETAVKEYFTGEYSFGILICGTGIGVSLTANKMKGVYCALVFNSFMAKMAKEHNDANFLAFGSRLDYKESFKDIITAYLSGSALEERHKNRLNKMKRLENNGI